MLFKIVRKKYRKENRFTSLISPQKQDSREEKLTDGQKVAKSKNESSQTCSADFQSDDL